MLQRKFKNWVNWEDGKKLDKVRFPNLPLKMRIGIFMLMGSFSIGYGVPIILLVISKMNNQLATGLLNGSLVYIACWPIGAIGLALAGRDSIKYPIYFSAKFLKLLFPKYFVEENQDQDLKE